MLGSGLEVSGFGGLGEACGPGTRVRGSEIPAPLTDKDLSSKPSIAIHLSTCPEPRTLNPKALSKADLKMHRGPGDF